MVRFKNRYLVVQIKCSFLEENADFKVSNKELELRVLNIIKLLHGDFGAGAIQTCFKVRYCNPTTKIIIFKTRHGPHKFLSSAVPFVNKLQEKPVQLSTIYTGASLFQCYKFILNYQKDLARKLSNTISLSTKKKILNVAGILKFDKSHISS